MKKNTVALTQLVNAFANAKYKHKMFTFNFDANDTSDFRFLSNLRSKMADSDNFVIDYFGYTLEVKNLDEFKDIDENFTTSEMVNALLELEVTPFAIIEYHNEVWVLFR